MFYDELLTLLWSLAALGAVVLTGASFAASRRGDGKRTKRLGLRVAAVALLAGMAVLQWWSALPLRLAVAWCGENCRPEGACEPMYEAVFSQEYRCRVPSDAACRSHDVCTTHGQCGLKKGRCIAVREEDCAASTWCRRHGACQLSGEKCLARTDADCAASIACKEEGRCHLKRGCVPLTDADCTPTTVCKEEGRCRAIAGVCRVTDADCAKRPECDQAGRCIAGMEGLRCVVHMVGPY